MATVFETEHKASKSDFRKDEILSILLSDKLKNNHSFFAPKANSTNVDLHYLNELYVEGLIEKINHEFSVHITDKGLEVAGKGYLKLKLEEYDKNAYNIKSKNLEFEIKEKQNNQLDFFIKTKWIPLVVSLLAFLVAFTSLIYTIWFKK